MKQAVMVVAVLWLSRGGPFRVTVVQSQLPHRLPDLLIDRPGDSS